MSVTDYEAAWIEVMTNVNFVDYVAMSSGELLTAVGDDAYKWADAFCQTAKRMGINGIESDWMIGWFANAIEHSSDVRRWRMEKK